jgi:D-alanine-D-alanine ligase
MRQRIGVLVGGWGEEREISFKTGAAVLSALEELGNPAVRIVASSTLPEELARNRVEVAFLALHGRMGEDGRVQGLLEVLGVPYTGSGVLASALAMNKPFAKKLFRLHNLQTPPGYTVQPSHIPSLGERHGDLGFPCVVKPSSGGSSVGASRVCEAKELASAVGLACRYGGEALVERHIRGKEVTVAVLDGTVLGTCEMVHRASIFDFKRKYTGGTQYFLPPRLSTQRLGNIEEMASVAYRALGCRGYARIDFIAGERENDHILEVNSLPGLTQTSLFPKIAAKAGLSFPQLVERILGLARLDSAAELPDVLSPDHPHVLAAS